VAIDLNDAREELPGETPEITSPPDAKTVFLGGIFIILCLIVLRLGAPIFVPLFVAIGLKFVLVRPLRLVERLHVPRKLASALVVLMLMAASAGVISLLAMPASEWASQIPDSLPQLKSKLRFLSKPVEQTQDILKQAEDFAAPVAAPKVMAVSIEGSSLSDKFFSHTQAALATTGTMLLILFFLLAAGDTFLRKFVEMLPTFRNKRQIVDISNQIEADISLYLTTITFMNACVGVATGLAMWAFGLKDPILWGAMAFTLNYLPVVGVMVGMATLSLVGFMEIDGVWQAAMPALTYMGIHVMESSFITPLLLARRLTLNPVLVILSLIFWYWMWGFAGAVMAVPMLAITKIVCDRVGPLKPVGHFLEG